MDSITRQEFHGIFSRTSKLIRMKGLYTPDAIDEKLKKSEKILKEARGLTEDKGVRKRLSRVAKNLKKLRTKGSPTFSQKTIIVAAENPKGIVNLTLLHGRTKAKEILLSRRKAQLGIRRRQSGHVSRYSALHRRE